MLIYDNVYTACFIINGHDYTRYLKMNTGLTYSRENTNDEDAGRDEADVMHTNVLSHQRKLEVKMLEMPFAVAMQLEHDLQDNDDGVEVTYPDLYDGICKRLFYNTSIKGGVAKFNHDGVYFDDISFTLISVKEEVV